MTEYKEYKNPRPIFVRKGKNRGKEIGRVFFKLNYPRYLLIEKAWGANQLFFKPELREYQWLSTTAIEDAKSLGVELIIYSITGFETERTFFIVFTLREFEESRNFIGYDDKQVGVKWGNKVRHYEFPRSLYEFVGVKENALE